MRDRWVGRLATLAMGLTLVGCAGTVRQDNRITGDATHVAGVAQVEVQMSPDAAKQQADNAQFNSDELAGFLRRKLEGKGLVGADSVYRVNVVVTDIRVRSAAAAVLFGVFAGDDHVTGKVRLLDGRGQPVRSFDVSASYALGGIGGGQDSTRMNWLYDKFSELALGELQKLVDPPAHPVLASSATTGTAAALAHVASPAAAPAYNLEATGIDINDVQAVPGTDKTRQVYREFLAQPTPRAFVVADGGRSNYTWGTNPKDPMEPKDPLERAMKRCQDQGKQHCRPYAVDHKVVYRPDPAVSTN
jgi:hypothetical protein